MVRGNSRPIRRRIIAIPKHAILAGKNIAIEGVSMASNVINRTINGVVRMGNTTSRHLSKSVKDLANKKRKTRKIRKSRK